MKEMLNTWTSPTFQLSEKLAQELEARREEVVRLTALARNAQEAGEFPLARSLEEKLLNFRLEKLDIECRIFGEKVRFHRALRGLTQVDLAKKAAIPRSSLIGIEKGEDCKYSAQIALALALGVPLRELQLVDAYKDFEDQKQNHEKAKEAFKEIQEEMRKKAEKSFQSHLNR